MPRVSTHTACKMFADRFDAQSNGSFRSEWVASGLMAVSYSTPIAYIPLNEPDTAYVVEQRFSVTTSKQQSWIRGSCAIAGLTIVPVPTADDLRRVMRHDERTM